MPNHAAGQLKPAPWAPIRPDLDLSLVVPLADARGDALEHLRSWIDGQTHPRERYQLVVVSDSSLPESDAEIAARLRPQDRFLTCPGANEMTLYSEGARAAESEILFWTELHCIARPDCIAEVVTFMRTHGELAGGYLANDRLNRNDLARMEEFLYTETHKIWGREDHWDKVRFHGFAIRNRIYRQIGGLEPDYALFCTPVLGARLHSAGHRLGMIPTAWVTHINNAELVSHHSNVANYVLGECAFRESHDPDYCERYLGHAHEWANRYRYVEGNGRALARSAAKVFAREALSSLSRLRPGRAARKLGGAVAARAGALPGLGVRTLWKRLQLAALEWYANHFCRDTNRLWKTYERAWRAAISLTRLEYIRAHPPQPVSPARTPELWPISGITDVSRIGFHGLEEQGRQQFRWSEPCAMLRLSLPRRDCEVTLRTGGIRGVPQDYVRGIFWNRHRVPPGHIRHDQQDIHIRIQSEWFRNDPVQLLVWVCDPLIPARHGSPDDRRLGLPLVAVEVRPKPATPAAIAE